MTRLQWNEQNATLMKLMRKAKSAAIKIISEVCCYNKEEEKLRFIWITNSSDYRRIWTANFLHTNSLPNPLGHKAILWHSWLDNEFVRRRFAVQTFLWSLEFVIEINLEHDIIAVWNLARSWSILRRRIPNWFISNHIQTLIGNEFWKVLLD